MDALRNLAITKSMRRVSISYGLLAEAVCVARKRVRSAIDGRLLGFGSQHLCTTSQI